MYEKVVFPKVSWLLHSIIRFYFLKNKFHSCYYSIRKTHTGTGTVPYWSLTRFYVLVYLTMIVNRWKLLPYVPVVKLKIFISYLFFLIILGLSVCLIILRRLCTVFDVNDVELESKLAVCWIEQKKLNFYFSAKSKRLSKYILKCLKYNQISQSVTCNIEQYRNNPNEISYYGSPFLVRQID